jgi:hypothetical protein
MMRLEAYNLDDTAPKEPWSSIPWRPLPSLHPSPCHRNLFSCGGASAPTKTPPWWRFPYQLRTSRTDRLPHPLMQGGCHYPRVPATAAQIGNAALPRVAGLLPIASTDFSASFLFQPSTWHRPTTIFFFFQPSTWHRPTTFFFPTVDSPARPRVDPM